MRSVVESWLQVAQARIRSRLFLWSGPYRADLVNRAKDSAAEWVAWHLPTRVAYFCTVRVGAFAGYVLHEREVPGITVIEAMTVWRDRGEVEAVDQ